MPTYQAVFTPSVPSSPGAINIMIFPDQGQLETVKEYRVTENHGLVGNFAILLEEKSQVVVTRIIGEFAIEATMKAAENFQGTLNLRGTSLTYVRLMSSKRVRLLGVTVTPGTPIATAGTYIELETSWIKEGA